MNKKLYTNIILCFLALTLIIICVIPGITCMAAESESTSTTSDYVNDSGVIILDDAMLLQSNEKEELKKIMLNVSEYGNVMFITTFNNKYTTTRQLADNTYRSYFGDQTGVAFVIDMDERNIWIAGFGNNKYVITDSYCDTITDNIYKYASNMQYYQCAYQAFEQINALLHGKSIPRPMKNICNALFAISVAFIFNYFLVMFLNKKRRASHSEIKESMIYSCEIYNPSVKFNRERKTYNPHTSSSSGGGSSGGGGGGGGGGSSGGGHSF